MRKIFQITITGLFAIALINACERPYETDDVFKAEFNTRIIETIVNGKLTSDVVVDENGCYIATIFQDDNPFLIIGPLCNGEKGETGERGASIISEIKPYVENGDTTGNLLTIYEDVEPLGVVNPGDIPQSGCLIKNGEKGDPGEDGKDGADGQDGEDGEDGTNTVVTKVVVLAPKLYFTPLGEGCFNHFWWYDLDDNKHYTDSTEFITEYEVCVYYEAPKTYALYFPFTHGDTHSYLPEGMTFKNTSASTGAIWLYAAEKEGYFITQELPENDQLYAVAFTHAGTKDHRVEVYAYEERETGMYDWKYIGETTGEGQEGFEREDAKQYEYYEAELPEGMGRVKNVKLVLVNLEETQEDPYHQDRENVRVDNLLLKMESGE